MQQDYDVWKDPDEDESPPVRTTGDFESSTLARSSTQLEVQAPQPTQRQKRQLPNAEEELTPLELAWDRSRSASGNEPTQGD